MPDLNAIAASLAESWADYLVYAAIIIVTLTGVFKCLLPLRRTTHALNRATRILEKDTHDAGQIPRWQAEDFLGSRLQGCWKRFLQNARELDRRSLPCNVEDYVNDDTVTHGPGNAALAELIPSLLTSLGILGTFIGLMQGLTGLDMSNASTLMNGIPVLLNGMKFAFGTSVVGISCSLVFNMLNRIAQGKSYRAIDEFIDTFTLLAMRRPLDTDVQMMIQNQDSYNLLAHPTEGLVPQLAGSIELAVSRAMNPVSQSMSSFLKGATQAQVEGVQQITTNFINEMNRSLGSQFIQLGKTIGEVNGSQQASLKRLEDSLAATGRIVADAEKLRTLSEDLLRGMQNAAREQKDNTLELRESQEKLVRAIDDFCGKLDSLETDAAASSIAGSLNDMKQLLTGLQESLRSAEGK